MAAVLGGCVGGGCDGGALVGSCASVFCNKHNPAAAGGAVTGQPAGSTGCGVGNARCGCAVFPTATGVIGRGRGGTRGGLVGEGVRGGVGKFG